MVRSKVNIWPRALKQSRRIYDPSTTATTPMMNEGVTWMGLEDGRGQTRMLVVDDDDDPELLSWDGRGTKGTRK